MGLFGDELDEIERESGRNYLRQAQEAYNAGERTKALYLFTCCEENRCYTEDDSYRNSVNDAIKQLLGRRGLISGFIMPRPDGAILPEELYHTVQMIMNSDLIAENKKNFHIGDYLRGSAQMGYAQAQYDLAISGILTSKAAVEYCEKAAAQGHKEAIALLPQLQTDAYWDIKIENYEELSDNERAFISENWEIWSNSQRSKISSKKAAMLKKKADTATTEQERNLLLTLYDAERNNANIYYNIDHISDETLQNLKTQYIKEYGDNFLSFCNRYSNKSQRDILGKFKAIIDRKYEIYIDSKLK